MKKVTEFVGEVSEEEIETEIDANVRVSKLASFKKINWNTVIPRFTRLLWQPQNRVNRKSRYTSHSVDKKIVKKICTKLKFYTIKPCYTNLFGQDQKTA